MHRCWALTSRCGAVQSRPGLRAVAGSVEDDDPELAAIERLALIDFLPMIGGALEGVPTVLFAAVHSRLCGQVAGRNDRAVTAPQPGGIEVEDQLERRIRKPVDLLRCVWSCVEIVALAAAGLAASATTSGVQTDLVGASRQPHRPPGYMVTTATAAATAPGWADRN